MKRSIFLCFFACFVIFLLFHRPLISLFVHWSIQAYVQAHWDQPLHYEQFHFEGNRLIILKPELKKNPSLIADKISFTFNFNFFTRELDIDIALDHPKAHFQSLLFSHRKNWEKLFSRQGKWIRLRPRLQIKEALLNWKLKGGPETQFLLDMKADHREGGIIHVYFDQKQKETNCLKIQASPFSGGIHACSQCCQVDCVSLFALAQLFGFEAPFSVQSGLIHGQVHTYFPSNQRPYTEGEVKIENVSFYDLLGSEWKAKIEEASILLKKHSWDHPFPTFSSFLATLEIVKPASFTYFSSQHIWELHHIVGRIKLHEEKADLDLESAISCGMDEAYWSVKGLAALNSQRELNLDLNASRSDIENGGAVRLSLYSKSEGRKQGDLHLNQLSPLEYNSLKNLAVAYFPLFDEMALEEGTLNAKIETEMVNGKIKKIEIKQFEVFQLHSKFLSKKIDCCFHRVAGEGTFCLQDKDRWQFLHGGLHLEEGEIAVMDSPDFFPLKAIQAHLNFSEDVVDESFVTLEWAGLKGVIKRGQKGNFLTLEGKVNHLIDFFPASTQENLHLHFDEQPLAFVANLGIDSEQLKIEGDLHLPQSGREEECIHFSCEWGIEKNGLKSLIPVGTFYTKRLSLATYFAPFIFRNEELKLTGEVEAQGKFDECSLTLKYRLLELAIENRHLCLKKEATSSDSGEDLFGEHTFDWHHHSHKGVLPIHHFSYLLKAKNLLFEDIQGIVNFEKETLSISPIEAYCEGIYFSGCLDLDCRDPSPGVFDLSISCPIFFGTVSQVQSFLSHFTSSPLLNQIPLQGECSAKEKGLNVHFMFTPHHYDLEGEVQGSIGNAVLSLDKTESALKGLYMDVHYEHHQQTLTLTEIQGTWLVGKQKRMEEYLFYSPCLTISHLIDPNIAIDFSVFKDKTELMRCVGYTETKIDAQGLKSIYLDLDKSHLSAFRFQQWHCLLQEGGSIKELMIEGDFDLGLLLKDFQGFKGLLGRFEPLLTFDSFCGKGKLSFHYDPLNRSYKYHFDLPSLQGKEGGQHRGGLKGSWQDHKWIIEQLEWDDWALYAAIEYDSDQWKIPFLGLSLGKAWLIGLEGNYLAKESCLQAQLKYCRGDDQQAEWRKWKPVILQWLSTPFELQLKEKNLLFSTQLKEENFSMKVVGEIEGPCFTKGTLLLFDEQSSFPHMSSSPLVIHWGDLASQEWGIQAINGEFYGCSFHLLEDFDQIKVKKENILKGEVSINFDRLSVLFDCETRKRIEQLKLSSSYFFQGKVKVDFEGERISLWDALSYEGEIISQPSSFKGFQLQSMVAHLTAVPGRIELQNMRMEDPAGECQIAQLTAIYEKEAKQWSIFIPRIKVKNLKPALLKEEEAYFFSEEGKYPSLVIKRLDIQDFFGILHDPSSWQGNGSLHFLNPSRKNLSHPLLAIPAEIILRLGLDSQVLSPITGTVYFELKDERFYLTRFKDVYSEGRGSKFYLAQGPTASWVDLNGRLFVQIRMKHYNLFFKLAELFTVSVQGTLRHPVYMLTKQNKSALRRGHFLSIDL